MIDYTTRNWTIRELSFKAIDDLPKEESAFRNEDIVGMLSQAAVNKEEAGVTHVFYFDFEQEAAGLDKIYGCADLFAATEDFALEDGFEIKAGALIFPIHRMDFQAMTQTVLFEVV